jgi:hypothetical protein
MGAGNLKVVVAPLIVIFTVTPLIVVVSLVVVAVAMTPALVSLVAERRFATLERKKGGSLLMSLAVVAGLAAAGAGGAGGVHSAVAGSAAGAGAAAVDLGLAHLPRDGLRCAGRPCQRAGARGNVPPPSRVAAGHGRGHGVPGRGAQRGVGLGRGCLRRRSVLLVPVAIWIYTLVFAFSSLWFAHYCLAALEKLRAESASGICGARDAVPAEPLALPDGATRSRSCS